MKKTINILYLYDYKKSAKLNQIQLKNFHLTYSSKPVSDLDSLLSCLSNIKPDIVVSECNFTNMTIDKLLATVNTNYLDVPVIVINGSITDEVLLKYMADGLFDFVPDYNIFRLNIALRNAITRKSYLQLKNSIVESELNTSKKTHKENEEFLRVIIENSLNAIVVIDDPGNFLFVNKAAEDMFGYSQNQLLLMNMKQIKDSSGNNDIVINERSFENGREIGEFSFFNSDGDPRTAQYHSVRVKDNFNLSILSDITTRINSEKKLHESELVYRNIYNHTPVMLHSIDMKGCLLSVSDFWLDKMGYERSEVLGRKSTDFLSEKSKIYAKEVALPEFFKKGKVSNIPYEFIKKNGQVINTELSAIAEYDNSGNMKRTIAVVIDITNRVQAENELKFSKERFELAMKASQDGLYDWNLVTNNIYYSVGWKKMLGYEDNELPNDFSIWENLTDPIDVKKSWLMQQELISKKRDRFELEFKMKHKDGHWVDILSRAEAVFDEEGKAIRMIGTHVDISELKKIEMVLRESERKFRNLADTAQVSIAIVVPTNKKGILYVNKYWEKLMGYSKEESMQLGALDTVHPDHRAMVQERAIKRLAGEDVPKHYELKILTKSGQTKWLDFNATRIEYEGKPASLTTAIDITERKKMEEDLSKLAALIDQSIDDIMITDKDGIIQYVNPAFEKISGYSLSEVKGKAPKILQSGRHGKGFYKDLWDTIQSGNVWSGIITNKAKDGSFFEETTTIFPIFDKNNEILTYGAIKRDTAESRIMEERLRQSQKMKAIGNLAGGIAHDFNNILHGISSYTQLSLRKLPEQDEVHSYLEQVLNASDRAAELVSQILTFSRQEERELIPLKAQLIIKEVLNFLRSSIPSTFEIVENIDPDCETILADPTQVHQVVMNLVTNSYHAMKEKGSGKIDVSLTSEIIEVKDLENKMTLSAGKYIKLSVSDTGIGIPKNKIQQIFEPYFTTNIKGEGTGLGLSIVYGIINSYNGEILVESTPGKGTSFQIYLPVFNESEIKINERDDSLNVPGGSEHIMVIDDDDILAIVNKEILEDLGYSVSAFTSSLDALKNFREKPGVYDLILTDMTMPGLTGKDLAKQVLLIRPEIPVILCSGFSDMISKEDANVIGIREYIMKPITIENLALSVRRELDREV